MKNQHNQNLLLLTLATLLISTSGALGRFISMPTEIIIWWRSALGAVFLFMFCKLKKVDLKIQSKKDFTTILISAVFLGAHWITYFYALKLSNVALGMLSLFTFPVITALIEPFFTKTKLNPIHILLALMVLLGIYILAPDFNFESTQIKGILCGLLSALFYAIRNLMLKKPASKYNGMTLMMYQTLFLTLILLPVLFIKDNSNITTQYPYVILLALVTTAIGHSLLISCFKHFSISTASIIGSSQPIFGIIIAFLFLNEIPTLNTFIGGALIIGTVVIESIRSRK
ncbi:EamA family transporter [Algibacter amylolyticus]|uniref:EamA family transporter n=1 Tax=Algibacter amylolyticus TaxID=1608400 RepID=A0A5M7BGE6_9FLAO|nr:DMT family transporter [Algibacter amylolyticus]KAA5827973.1 EamA family transporter [Algibacter amylolyticus]MBB5267211.1 drug/metabolite transporter (DMT)-like permease [Algibacter amylolyticus]TSJ82218.1 EamA family transporter [Algibacter amylolyticus]